MENYTGDNNTKTGRSYAGSGIALSGLIISGVWLLNLTCGIVEIPDNLPVVGNLDEALFSGIFLACLRYFGIDPTGIMVKRNRKEQ